MFRELVFAAVIGCAGAAAAADQPRYAPLPAWVVPLPIPDIPPPSDGSPLQTLLQDSQSRFVSDINEFFAESAFKILKPQGLAAAASIPLSWNPETEDLTFHRLAILRDGKTIDLLDGGKKVQVLRRESNLELAMLDGRLTATLQPEGLRVGDVIDMAVTIERHDPVFQGRAEANSFLRHAGVAGRVHVRDIWVNSKPVRWKATEGLPTPTVTRGKDTTELLIDQANFTAPKAPLEAPPRFRAVGELEVSQFQSWAEVSGLMAPLYSKAATLQADSPLQAEIAKIRKGSDDPKARAEAAVRLVQDQVHYVFIGMNFGGFTPAEASLTWTRRYGDCKGKTALLLALLHGLGVEAEPALVSTTGGDALGDQLPMLAVFDHVFVRAMIKGKVYWLDGTRSGDRALDDIPIPDFHWVLPVRMAGGQLEKIQPKRFEVPEFESLQQLDATAGYAEPAKGHIEHIFRGDSANGWNVILNGIGQADAERRLREYWRGVLPWLDAKSVAFTYDESHHVMRLIMDGQGKMDWVENGSVRDFQIDGSDIGFSRSFKREPGPYADAPISVPYPLYRRWTVTIALPNRGQGYRLLGADADKTVAGRNFRRHSRIEAGVVTMTAQEEAVAPEFPFTEAETASAELRALAAHDVFVRGPGKPAAAPDPAEDELAETPTDAAGFSRRGVTFLNRREYDRAVADFTAAARLEPREGKHLYNRAAAFVEKKDDAKALADLNEALRLNSKDVLAYLARGELLLRKGDAKGWKDFDQGLAMAPKDVNARDRRAAAYDLAGRYREAIDDLSILLAGALPRERRPAVLNARCWVRAEWGRDLDEALTDCNAALNLAVAPDKPAILDSRGLVELRQQAYDKAIATYDESLSLEDKHAASLFGRGLAKLHKGKVTEGRADIAAALAIDPAVEQEFAKFGVRRPAG